MTDTLPDVRGLAAREAKEPGYMRALFDLTQRTGLDADHLAASIAFESKHDPAARNPVSNASGLIQWMPQWAPVKPPEALRAMTAIQQLPLIEKYFSGRKLAPRDVYLAIFYPAAIGTSDDHVIASAPSQVYVQNAGIDRGKKGYITTGDCRSMVEGPLAAAASRPRLVVPGTSVSSSAPPLLVGGLLVGLAYAAWRWFSKGP